MKLFNSLHTPQEVDFNVLNHQTPIGKIYYNFIFDGQEILNISPPKTELIGKAIVSCWDLNECYLEFLQAQFLPKIPSTMKVESCIAGIWRFKTLKKLKPIIRVNLDSELVGDPESGEGLISQSFEKGSVKLSIGTEDEDFLAARAHTLNWMPSRLQNILDSDVVEYLPTGLQINLPQLEQNENVQIQSIIAWSTQEYPAACWFAVEQSADYILKSLEIK